MSTSGHPRPTPRLQVLRERPLILVADDEPLIVSALDRVLQDAGFDTVSAGGGAEALRLASRKHPDAIVLDLRMPDMEGLEVCRRLRAEPGTETIPILIVSGSEAGHEGIIRSLRAGASDYMAKPLGAEELVARIGVLVRVFRAEAEVQRTRDYVENVVQNAGALILTWDKDGRIASLNPAAERALGLDARALAGRPVASLFPDAEQGRYLARRAVEDSAPHSIETRLAATPGREVDVLLTASPLRDGSGHVTGAVCIANDITARKRLEFYLSRQDRLLQLGQFVTEIVHELGNPLHQLNANVPFLREDLPPDERREIADDVGKAVWRMTRFLESLRQLGRPQIRDRVPLRANLILRAALREHAARIREACVEVLETLGPDPLVLGDETRLVSVFSNIIRNAVEAMAEQAGPRWLTITSIERGPSVAFRFADNGPGIPPSTLSRIFEPFFTTKTGRGTGLGLAISYRTVLEHGGSLWAESTPNVETSFWVELPIWSPNPEHEPPPRDGTPARGTRLPPP
jgi:PAS domain S-box-containing protein